MLHLSRQNMLSGLLVFLFAILLYSQTFGLEDAATTEGIHPMGYPKFLLYSLMITGSCIAFLPSKKTPKPDDIPLFSLRTATVSALMIVYVILLGKLGFGISSFIAASSIGYAMGWRKINILLASNLLGIAIIWAIFKYILLIPLPTGSLL